VPSPLLTFCELPNFGADVRVQVGHLAVVNPIERDAAGGELERLIGRDALQAGFVGSPGGLSVPNRRAIWNRVRSSARRVSAKRAPISGNLGSGFLYTKRSVRLVPDVQHRNQLRGSAFS